MKTRNITIWLVIFLSLFTLLESLVSANGNDGAKSSENTGGQFDKFGSIGSDGELIKEFSETSETSKENIIKKVEAQDVSFKRQRHWDGFETVTINVEEFKNTAANGNVNLRLLERDFEVKIKEISMLNGGKSCRYSGCVNGIPQSKATFYVCGELLSGSIEIEDLMYNIAVTSEVNDGKTVYTIFVTDWNKDRERLKHLLNPLTYLTFGQETKADVLLSSPPLEYSNINFVIH